MRSVIEGIAPLPAWTARYVGKRRKPLFYEHPTGAVILGHYEATCGGCDNVGSAAAVYGLINEVLKDKPVANVLCEGLLLSEDTKWTLELHRAYPGLVRVVFLTTSVGECLNRVRGRREAAGNEKPLNPANTENRVGVIERARTKLSLAGVYCRRVSSEQAPGVVLGWLRGS